MSNSDATSTIIYFAVIIGALVAGAAAAWVLRRRDVARLDAVAARIDATSATAQLTESIADASASVEHRPAAVGCSAHRVTPHGTAGLQHAIFGGYEGNADLLNAVGLGSRLTSSTVASSGKIVRAWIDHEVLHGQRPGIAAALRLSQTTSSAGFASKGSATTPADAVIVRLGRPIHGSMTAHVASGVVFDSSNFGRFADRIDATGLADGQLTDPDLAGWFVTTTDSNRLVAADAGLRALLWSVRRRVSGSTPTRNARTDGYEAASTPRTVSDLRVVAVDGDLLMLATGGSPFRSGPSDELIQLAEHVAAWFS